MDEQNKSNMMKSANSKSKRRRKKKFSTIGSVSDFVTYDYSESSTTTTSHKFHRKIKTNDNIYNFDFDLDEDITTIIERNKVISLVHQNTKQNATLIPIQEKTLRPSQQQKIIHPSPFMIEQQESIFEGPEETEPNDDEYFWQQKQQEEQQKEQPKKQERQKEQLKQQKQQEDTDQTQCIPVHERTEDVPVS